MPNFLLFLSIILGALGQVFFKFGVNKTDSANLRFYLDLASNIWIISGFFCYGLSFIIWMKILQYFDVSYARPMTALGYIATYLLAIFFLGESFTVKRLAGIFLITCGVILIK